ncbi:MAG TPA: beta-ketoacyl-ACP synthase 3 [Actinocrinis sp.]|uniref:beta-ketoacyl-ACP synthase 3 n=1 Tax=Actinocrinis sp. TaxID=1920516 RepID=UPI002DDCF520|nr:beta-ketoacyl-ACP synthase 3 [Actinocrinis sp.]HEV2347886.1 beta-ketoacyl-ACP synthase 3 [Actinocrinis sp.]
MTGPATSIAGSSDEGLGGMGSGGTQFSNTGFSNTGFSNTGFSDAGSGSTELSNTRSGNAGSGSTRSDNTGFDNTEPGGRRRAAVVPAAVIAGLGGWLPGVVVTNDQLAARLDTSDQWIRQRTGIRERRHAGPGWSTGMLAVEASRLALKAADRTEVDAVVLATTTPDQPCPATAPWVAAVLGLSGVAAFDIAAVCTGFLYGLAAASGLIASGHARSVLLIGAETYSSILDPGDRTTTAIFGDGAGAVVLRAGDPDEPGAVRRCLLGSDGEQAQMIQVPGGGSRQRLSGRVAQPGDEYFQMQGRYTYRHAVDRMTESSLAALRQAGWSIGDVDRFVAHQANARITEAVGERLGLAADRTLANIARVGNTAAASIPLLLAESAADGTLRPGHRTLLAAFGGGLTWGATTLVWPDVCAYVGTADAPRGISRPPAGTI